MTNDIKIFSTDFDYNSNEIEYVVEDWLNKHNSWFKTYAIENLDISTVEKWLRLNGKQICRCKKLTETTSFNTYLRRKSLALPTDANALIKPCKITPSFLEKNPTESENNARRSSSFNSLISSTSNPSIKNELEHLLSKLNNNTDSQSESNPSFYLDSPVDTSANFQNDCSLESMENSENDFKFKTPLPKTDKNSTLLKSLIKSKIKLPNRGVQMNLEDKIKLKLSKLNDYEVLFSFISDTSKEICLKDLNEKLLLNLQLIGNAEQCSLFYISRNKQKLASFKFDPVFSNYGPQIVRETFEIDSYNHEFEHEIPLDSSLLGSVVQHGNLINLNRNQVNDPKYKPLLEKLAYKKIKTVLCLPIKNVDQEIIAVVQLLNKKGATDHEESKRFTDHDIKLLNRYLEFCSTVIVKAQINDLCAYEYERNRSLIEALHDLFQQQTDIDKMLLHIMKKTLNLLNCQRCSILLQVDNDDPIEHTYSRKAFDLVQDGNKHQQRRQSVFYDDEIKISRELVDYVLSTGNKINLNDAYLDPRFDPNVDDAWDYKTKSKLIMPIKNLEGMVIGCARVSNRLDNQPFDENDEHLLEAFCIFCGLSINNTLIYNQLEKSMAEKSVALEVLSYHSQCSLSDLNSFMSKFPADDNFTRINKSILKEYLSSYIYDDFALNSDEMIFASYEIFKKSGLMKTFKIDKKTFIHWLLTVRKNYRDVEYHNWNHAFNVCQSMFAIFENSLVSIYLQDIEKLALLVGCLCHDLDHRGTNNIFQVECFDSRSHSALSQLYGTTGIMEKHHFNHCIMIFNSPGHNIFSNVKPKTYQLLISLIKEAILATDLVDHFSVRNKFEEAVKDGTVYWTEESNSLLLRKNLMTCCDLASVAKPWPIHKKIVNLVTKEFFAQGDRERLELNIEPNEMMDARRSHELPRLQISWIDSVCFPLYKNFSTLCESFYGHLERIQENRRNWSFLHSEKTFKIRESPKNMLKREI